MSIASDLKSLSWRDPDGFVVKEEGRILRAVMAGKSEHTKALLRAPPGWFA